MNSPAGRTLVFPSLEWFETLQHLVNADTEFRGLGSIDTQMGVKIGPRVFVITFQAFECTGVREGTEIDLLDLDFYLEMSEADWREMLQNIKDNGGADRGHTLNSLDLTKEISNNATGDQYRADIFFRVNESLQRFFNLSAQLDTAFED